MTSKLFVRNLSWYVTEADLLQLFSQVGTVISAKIPLRREDNKPRGFAFVEMDSERAAAQAISQLDGAMLDNRPIAVAYQQERSEGSFSNHRIGATGQPQATTKLFIRNIAPNIIESDLEQIFTQAGSVVNIHIPRDMETQQAKGFAFVEMGSVQEAQYAVDQLNQAMCQDQALQVTFQDPNRSRQKSGGQGFSGGGGYRRQSGYGNDSYGNRDRGADQSYGRGW